MKKLLQEFKTFITRGNVIDLAVGMIIGAAFTAIVSALVNGIFTPLINAIPMGDMHGLITVLKAVYTLDADGNQILDLAASVYINWGEFIMAIINFLITAIVLFLIIKVINTVREGGKKLQGVKISKEQKAELKAQGMNRKQMQEYVIKQQAEEAARAAAEAEANKPETTEQILSEIRELLKALQANNNK
ncbi:MAG: large conductance mechanosensitive channel protein MscL [Clostridiales bacterium]|nr:large conductance mechanosensitive channel protein MscL [Clostridiales bacterium]